MHKKQHSATDTIWAAICTKASCVHRSSRGWNLNPLSKNPHKASLTCYTATINLQELFSYHLILAMQSICTCSSQQRIRTHFSAKLSYKRSTTTSPKMQTIRLVPVAGSSVRPLGATGCPGRCGSGTGRYS
jgi:hypothetical protein